MNFQFLEQAFMHQPAPLLCAILAVSAAFLMGFTRSGIGGGGFVVSPLMVFALGSSIGVPVVAAIMLPAAVTGFWQHRKDNDSTLLPPLIVAAVAGTAVGGLVLWFITAEGAIELVHRRLELVVAALSLIYVFLVGFRQQIVNFLKGLGGPTRGGLFLTGSAVGLSQTISNSGSPMLTVYFLCHGVGKEQFVGAQVTFLLIQNFLKLVPLLVLGLLHLGNATVAIVLIPLTFLGSWLGQVFYKKASEKLFFRTFVLLLIIGFMASVSLLIGRDVVLAFF